MLKYLAVLLPCVSCVPYTVGSTAQTVPESERSVSLVWYSIPNGIDVLRDSIAAPFMGVDLEGRFGLTDRSDVGIRIPSTSGLVVTYKHRLTGGYGDDPAVAILAGAGFVNLTYHLHFEANLLASARQAVFTPYGGLRVSQIVPVNNGSIKDSPTAGGFIGLRIGKESLGVSPEVGFFYDRPILGLRRNNFIIVPAIVLHGEELVDIFLTLLGGGRRRR